MTLTESNYLKACFNAFQEISAQKYGKAFDLPAIERSVHHLRDQTRPLTYTDLRYFESNEHWWFEKYWVFPPEQHLTARLQQTTFNFWQLPRNERSVIEKLLDVFKSVELVSIILRFIKPKDYGIISPPVERVLDVRRGSDAVETYIYYLGDLRTIREQYGFSRAADADMALWVLHEKCFGALRDPQIEQAYTSDPFLRRLRAKNLVAPLTGFSDAQLADALQEVKPNLAALIACYIFELLVRKIAEASNVNPKDKLSMVIKSLHVCGAITAITKGSWQRYKEIRDRLFHDGQQPTHKQAMDLIKEVVQLEKDLPGFKQGRSGPA